MDLCLQKFSLLWMNEEFVQVQSTSSTKMCRFSLPLYFVGVIYLCVKIASSKVVQIWTEVMGRWKSCISIVYLYSHEYNLFIIHCVASWPKILLSYQLQNVQARLKNIIIWMIRIIYCTVFEFVCFMLFVWFLFCLFVCSIVWKKWIQDILNPVHEWRKLHENLVINRSY